jgi:hypothetical protein
MFIKIVFTYVELDMHVFTNRKNTKERKKKVKRKNEKTKKIEKKITRRNRKITIFALFTSPLIPTTRSSSRVHSSSGYSFAFMGNKSILLFNIARLAVLIL